MQNTKEIKKQRGITLIALVVTIVILIILATISINAVFGENGLIKMAEKAKILNAIKEKEEEVQFAITELMLENNMDASKVTVSAVVDKVKQNYKDQKSKNSISGASNEEGSDNFPGYIQYDKPSSTIGQTITVNVDENLNVSASAGEPSEAVKPPKSEYAKTGNTYYNTPDLSGFEPDHTYYIVYNKDGNGEKIYGRVDKVKAPGTAEEEEVPEEFKDKDMVWHDYENKIWANVVTVNGDEVTYWTWIPRYVYKITSGVQEADIKFVYEQNETNNYIDGTTDEVDNSQIIDYKTPESFKFGDTNLTGYWISKTEVQSASTSGIEKIKVVGVQNGIKVTTSEITEETESEDKYTIFLNGKKLNKENVTLPYTITSASIDREYNIALYNETDKRMIGSAEYTPEIEIDLSGFEPEHTYYVTYDENGNNEEVVGRIDKISQPKNWYNYRNKVWANLVTVKDNAVTYWTYIPRYEYVTDPASQEVIIRYISVDQKTPDDGFKIPESFKFGDTDLKGYWISKYEVQNSSTDEIEKMRIVEKENEIEVTTSKIAKETESEKIYTIFLNGEKYKTSESLPYTIKNTDLGENYQIAIYNEKDKRMIGEITKDSTSAIEIDLSGFEPEYTKYVTYDEDGNNETIGENIELDEDKKPTNAPENWYDYKNKIWANIVTEKDGLTTYWTYIPRYEYMIDPASQEVIIKYISVDKTTPDTGFKIPESFKFGDTDLKGYWISKYEVQGTIDN